MSPWFPLLFPLTFALLSIAEALFPARPLPRVPGWRLLGLSFFVLSGIINSAIPPLWSGFAARLTLFHLASLGTVGGALVGVLAFELANYFWHRARHASATLFRVHQMHHSAERFDVTGSAFTHPIDLVSVTALGSFSASILGVSAPAAALAGYVGFFLSTFQHANVRTPRWLGFLVQRPESHSVHHMRGVHAYNYSNLPVFDLLFGTFRNPAEHVGPSGFEDGASRRIGAMLVGSDVTGASPAAPATEGAREHQLREPVAGLFQPLPSRDFDRARFQ